ncbi:CBN-MAT-2 protein [Caenorhabditis brenneri]|uniref:CBN-MAT-2 protein n=1 Tax=Caenorhabditis brenneri TaxID=135651 RepID=G0MVE9_CAEBE|nr:CBN-MAT-2 protein [Caenorhabditis brenneri]
MVNDEVPGSSSSPTQSYCRLQTTASPFHVSHFTQMCRRGNSNADLLRDFTRMLRDTPANFSKNVPAHEGVDFGDLERDPDVDLLLSKVCLDCVYVEPKKGAIPKANKIFVSTFLSDMYLNLVSAEGKVMKIIPVWKNAETTKRNLLGTIEPVTVECVDAAFVMKSGITVTLGSDFTTTMYGGNEKISPLFIEELTNTREGMDFRLFPYSDNHIAALNEMRCIVLEIPPTVRSKTSSDLMRKCFTHMDREFAKKLLRKWRSVKRDDDLDRMEFEENEISEVAIFMLQSVGIRLTSVVKEPRAETPDGHGGKQMRPRMSDEEVLALMKGCFDDLSTKRTHDPDTGEPIEFPRRYTVELDNASGTDSEYVRDLMNAFHSQCEEWGINSLMHTVLLELAPYTYFLCKFLKLRDYEEYYQNLFRSHFTDYEFLIKFSNEEHEAYLARVPEVVPFWSLNVIISHLIDKRTASENLQPIPKPLSKELVRLLVVIATGRHLLGSDVELECRLFIGEDWKRRLGLTTDTLRSFRNIMKDSRLKAAERANQLMNMFKFDSIYLDYIQTAIKILLLKYQADAFAGAQSIVPNKCIYATPEESHSIAQLRWKDDIRKSNIELMLNSTRPVLIATNILRKSDEDNMKELQDRYLTQTSFRTFSQPFGRAYLDFRTSVPSLLTSLYIPRLCVGGMVYPARVTCDPPTSDVFKQCTEWGNFYNSLAAALRLGASDVVKIDNEWIVMVSKNIKSTAVIGGLTLGFGLNGHLAPFNMYHAHQMLSTFDKFHSIALLIGLPASNFTTCDLQIHKILATYLTFLMGPTPLEIKIDYAIQTAAVSGLGLLFADSGNMNIAKKLINEIGKAPNKDEEPITDRPAYKLAAGFALGLIMLGKGNGAASNVIPFKQNIPPMSQRLVYMMNGMRRDQCVFLPQSASPIVNEPSNLPFSNVGLMSSSQTANHVKEGDNINIHHCSEPAAIALGMMFMKTNNEFVAGSLALPDTITDIERIKPDSMYSRVLGYCLVMWDKIEPTHEFVKSLIPEVIQQYATSALHFGIPIPKDEDGEDVHEIMNDTEEKYWAEIIDTSTISQTFLYTVSAACMAIALKYSSCGGPEGHSIADNAFKLIEFYTKIVLPDGKSTKDMGSVRMCLYAGSFTRSSCFSMLVTAMSILRVGTGDLTVLRYARLLRMCDKPEGDWIAMGKKHFEQTVAHQALGILMMGEGRYAFKKDDLSIALTIISTFPTMPHSVSDNSHYHQPLRFLWSMAVEPRLLVPFDTAENCVVEVDVTIITKATRPSELSVVYKQKAPSLLPPLEEIESISVGGGNYEVVHINLQTPEELKVMKDVMSIGQGRIMLKRYNIEPDRKVDEASALYGQPFNVVSLLEREDSSLEIDDEEIRNIMQTIDEELKLNSSDEYPNVQVQLNCVKDIAERTPTALLEIQLQSLKLLGGSLDLWPDEVNVANTVYGLSEKLQAMKT